MRLFILIFIWQTACIYAEAQDVIHKSDGTKIYVSLLGVGQTQVRYKPSDRTDGPTFILLKSYIDSIIYKNGTRETFPKPISEPASVNRSLIPNNIITDFKKHNISINALDLMSGLISLNYSHVFPSGNFGFRVPIMVGFDAFRELDINDSYNDFHPRETLLGSGVDFLFYPSGQRRVSYFIGPSCEFYLYKNTTSEYDPSTSLVLLKSENEVVSRFLLQNGFSFQQWKHLFIGMNLGLGFQLENRMNYNEWGFSLRAAVNFGYKF